MEPLDLTKLTAHFEELCDRIKPFFRRKEVHQHACQYLYGLLHSPCGRNCWTLAETANETSPDGMQRLLSKSKWDHEALRAQVESEIYATLEDTATYWDLDETGFLKAGSHSVGVQRQYTGTAGKCTNCQIAVFLAFSSAKGYGLTDFRFYLPETWAKDRKRCQAEGIPDDVAHQTKGKLGVEMLTKAVEKGYEADWTTGDCVYGDALRPLVPSGFHPGSGLDWKGAELGRDLANL